MKGNKWLTKSLFKWFQACSQFLLLNSKSINKKAVHYLIHSTSYQKHTHTLGGLAYCSHYSHPLQAGWFGD